jgi:hypothetical protein
VTEHPDAERWLEWSGGRYPDDSPGDVILAYSDGTIILDDGVTTWNPLRALVWSEAQREAVTRWTLRSVGRKNDHLKIRLTVDTASGTVIEAIERAAAANGIVLDREADEAQP